VEHYLPLDFHLFRRVYNTGFARAGVNVQIENGVRIELDVADDDSLED
jgi:hypothetical protein